MNPIRPLSPEIAGRIAAGEVIENPASVVKELLENSLDADASSITVKLRNGGKSYIAVEDDGSGIPFVELPLSIERFATSKISDIDDLAVIRSFGYRGEALASVCAVSRMEIRSFRKGEKEGGMLRAEGGSITLHVQAPFLPGTRIQVEDLFYNLPARKNFLKGAATEARRAVNVVREYSAAFPEVSFSVFSDSREIFTTAGNLGRIDVLKKVWSIRDDPRHYTLQAGGLKIETVWHPIPGSKRRESIIFFNGRRVRDAAVSAALASCGEAASGNWMFLITVPSHLLDVNIHPGKAEVRFHSSLPVFDIVRRSVLDLVGTGSMTSESLGRFSGIPCPGSFQAKKGTGIRHRIPEYEDPLFSRVAEPPGPASEQGLGEDPALYPIRFLSRLSTGFLLYDGGTEIIIVDPHAAHERILYERISGNTDKGCPQEIPFPEQLPPSLSARVEEWRKVLEEMGFRFSGGPGSLELEAIPDGSAIRGSKDPLDILRSSVGSIEDGTCTEDPLSTAPMRACKAAVKIGDNITPEEADSLLADLLACENPTMCPHGRPAIIRIGMDHLFKLFGRG